MVADRSRLAVRSAVVAYAAATALLGLVTTLQPGTPEARQLVLNSAFLVGTATLFAACVARVARRSGRDRRGWLFVGLSTSWLVGNCWWFWYQELASSQPYPSWSDAWYLAALGFCAAIVSTYLPRAIDRRTKVRLVLDGLLVALGLLTLLYLLYLEASLQSMGSTPLLAVLVSTAYPLTEITLLTLVLLALRHGRPRDRSLRLLGAGLAAYLVADIGWNYQALHGGYLPGSAPFDMAWVLAYGLVALAALAPGSAEPDVTHSRLSTLAIVAPVSLAFVSVVALLLVDQSPLDPLDLCLVALLLALTLARQVLTARELVRINGALAAEVQEQTKELRSSHDRMQHLALHDSLTDLPNRRLLRRALDAVARPAGEGGRRHGLLLIDLDNFKGVNDGLGHDVGDQLLRHVSRRLQAVTRAGDLVARLGGDEFAVLLCDVDRATAVDVAERCLEEMRQPITLGSRERLVARASVGLVLSDPGDAPSDSLRRADVAMYAAKRGGRNRVAVYDASVHNAVVDMHQLESALFLAPLKDQLVLHYQPVVELEGGRRTGLEALVRWQHPERGLISPNEFIPMAERIGAIDAIGLWVLEEACSQTAAWLRADPDQCLRMSVNLSPLQLADAGIVRDVADVLARTGLPADRLVLEVTESALHDADDARDVLGQLRALGTTIALDDFGSGFSSLGQLRDMPVDILKIDRSFVRSLTADTDSRAYLRTIVELGQILGMTVCAEGVEEQDQWDVLRSLGCDLGQGWLFGRPAPAAAVSPAPSPLRSVSVAADPHRFR